MLASEENDEQIQVLVADSNQTQSQLLTSALRRQRWMTVRSCGSKLTDCLDALQSSPTDVAVLSYDPSSPDHQIDTVRGLHSSYPSVRLIFSADKYDRNRALCRCISVVSRGEFWVSTEQVGYVIEALRVGVRHRVVDAKNVGLLTPREEQVANMIADGRGNREVAQQLGVKENTIKKSLLRIYDKLGVSNRVELVLYVLTHHGTSTLATDSAASAEVRPKSPT